MVLNKQQEDLKDKLDKTIREIMHNNPKFDFKLIDGWMWCQIDEDLLIRLPYEGYDILNRKFEIKGSPTKFLEIVMGEERFTSFGKELRKKAIEKGLIPEDKLSEEGRHGIPPQA